MNAVIKSLKKIYHFIEGKWFALVSEKVRFVLVGGFNTVIGYIIFVIFYNLLNGNYPASIIIQNVISINISIIVMRYFVFHSIGNLGKEYAKALMVYIPTVCINYIWLFFAVDILGLDGIISQFVYAIVAAIMTYLLLKVFSFKKK